jgi:GxxExxY protein
MDVFQFRGRAESGVPADIEDLAHEVIGAAIEVHRHLRAGLPECVYKKALSHELALRGIPHICEQPVDIFYKGMLVGDGRIDIVVDGKLVVELKSVETLVAAHREQALAYLAVTRLPLALLINFNVAVLKDGIKRVINTALQD